MEPRQNFDWVEIIKDESEITRINALYMIPMNEETFKVIVVDELGNRRELFSTGEPGESATIQIGTVEKLSSNAAPTVTNVGTSLNAILNFGIPQGEQGIGVPGEAATIEIGNITTVAPNQPASVENVGTPNEAIFNFEIPKGNVGEAATIDIGTVTTVPSTDNATVTNIGDSTNAIFDFEIPKGNTGDAATIEVGTIYTLSEGQSADIINRGDETSAIFDFYIPKGDKGEKGDASTIQVGTVSSLEPNQTPIIENVGTSENAIFNFKIPRGQQGEKATLNPIPVNPTQTMPTTVGWYRPTVFSVAGTSYPNLTPSVDENGVSNTLKAYSGEDDFFFYDGTTWYLSRNAGISTTGKVAENNIYAVSGGEVYKTTQPIITTFFDTIGLPASPNLFNPANKYDNILVSTGANVGITGQSAGWNIAVVEVSPTKTYTVSGWNSTRNEIAFFSNTLPSPFPTIPPSPYATGLISSGSSATVLGITKSGGKLTFTPPANTKWMVFNIANASEADSVFATFQIEEGTVSTAYQPYRPVDTTQNILKEKFDPKGSVKEINKTGNNVLIRTNFNNTLDLVMSIVLNGSNNGASNLTSTKLITKTEPIIANGTIIHNINDSVPPPFQVNTKDSGYSNIAGNHGTPVLDATATSHGKTSADLGSIWTDGTGWDYYLVAILDANTLRIVGKPKNVSGFDRIKVQPLSPLTHVSGATNTGNITFTGNAYEYKPSINNVSVKLYVDDREITSDGTYTGETVKIIDTHNVVDPTQPNLTAPYLPQNNGTMVKNTLIHTFYGNGSYTAENIADWQKNTSVNNQGIIQPQVLSQGTYSGLNAYAMNVGLAGTLDFRTGVDLSGSVPTTIVTSTNFVEPLKAVQQMSQILFTSGNPIIGAGFGYNPLVGLGKQTELSQNSSLFELRNTKKYYPEAFSRTTGTNILRGIGYFAYWDATKNPKLSSDFYIPFGQSDLYFINLRLSMVKEKVYLKEELQLREFEVVNLSSGINIHTLDSSTSEGLIVSGGIGDWAILKFN